MDLPGSTQGALKTNWPPGRYFVCLLFGEITLAVFTPALDGHEANRNRAVVWLVILAIGIIRYVLAAVCREQSDRWIGYCIIWLLLAPTCLLGEALLRAFVEMAS